MNYNDGHDTPSQRKHWALAVLCLLRERDMHPYEMRRLIRERHKEERLAMKAGSLYHAIAWLEKQQLIERVETSRQGKRPERTVYRMAKAGEEALLGWLEDLLANPKREPCAFAVGLDHAVHLAPEEVAEVLQRRARVLEPAIKEADLVLATLTHRIGRINLLELEYERAVQAAELAWLRQVSDDLRSGALTWDINQILAYLRTAVAQSRPATAKARS